jgi:probable selenium-dependent hydroxylase accessory protein YqeC
MPVTDAEAKKAMRPLRELLEPGDRIVAFVGGGGKTSLMRTMARQLAGWGRKTLVTTTAMMPAPTRNLLLLEGLSRIPFYTHLTVGRGLDPESGLLLGVDPQEVPALGERFGADVVLVEADGPTGLPVKAPAGPGNRVPQDASLTIGVLGLDALWRPAQEDCVAGLSRFTEITGTAPGETVDPRALEALAAHPLGLFLGVPATSRRVVFHNKADAYEPMGLVFGSAHLGWFIRRSQALRPASRDCRSAPGPDPKTEPVEPLPDPF